MNSTVTAFLEDRQIASGEREAVTRLIENEYGAVGHAAIRVFDDASGRITDLVHWNAPTPVARGRGRPKLGVVPREVTLLPRHWEWLSSQPGGASAALRRLVEEARRSGKETERARRDAAYHFMQSTCGDRTGYEEALRALYKGDRPRFEALIAPWPEDLRLYIARLLGA